MDSAARLVAVIVLASFATERLLACLTFVFDTTTARHKNAAAAAKARAKIWRKLLLLGVGAAIAVGVVNLTGIRILSQLSIGNASPILDFWLTWFVLFAGADKIADIAGGGGGGSSSGSSAESDGPAIRIVIDRDGEVGEITRVS